MKSKALRIGLIGSGDDSSNKLHALLVEQGMQIVRALQPNELTESLIIASDLDVWLLDLDDSRWHDKLDELMDRSPVPIFFNEHQSIEGQQHLEYWCRNLISRMFELVADLPGLPPSASASPAAATTAASNVNGAAPAPKSAPAPAPAPSPASASGAASSPGKPESRPSDDLTPLPTQLDPELLKEIEELEQLLQQQPEAPAPELPALAPPPVATDMAVQAAIIAPAVEALAAAKSTTAVTVPELEPEPESEPDRHEPVPSDPVAAAKARAARIQQQRAQLTRPPADELPFDATEPAAAIADTSAAEASAAAAKAAAEKATAERAAAERAAAERAAAERAAAEKTAAEKAAAEKAAAERAAAEKAAAEKAAAEKAAAERAAAERAAAERVAAEKAAAEKAAAEKAAAEKAAAERAAAEQAAAEQAAADAEANRARHEPAPLTPERHGWPAFPPPEATSPDSAGSDEFAPIQPQPVPGPMRELSRPTLVRSTVSDSWREPELPAPASASPATPAAAEFAEPVPTLTTTSMDEVEFEAVDDATVEHEVAAALLPHADFDVPMLEAVATAHDFEDVPPPAPALPCELWVLGASLGGPAALKRFFAALDQPLPVCFLLAQHIDSHFLPVLGKILEQANPFYPVQVLVRPGLIEPGMLLLAPIEKRLRFLDAGQIVQGTSGWTPPYSPCIDDVLTDVASAYAGQVNSIVFSGMGEDGAGGARAIAGAGGAVWVQDSDSCASSVMPDAIARAGIASFRGTPEQLAARLMARYNPNIDSQNLA